MDSSYLYLNDSLNLRDLIEQINEFARTNNCEAKNARSFFVTLFNGISASDLNIGRRRNNNDRLSSKTNTEGHKEDSLIVYLQKLLSGNVPLESLADFTEKLLNEEIRRKLYSNLTPIVDDFTSDSGCYSFFQRLSQQVSPRFFQEEEIQNLDISLYCGDYHKFLFDLVIHGFKTLYNIPAFFSERILEEALSYDYDSPTRYELMRLAADSNKRAALEYGKYLAKSGRINQAFQYMIKALPMPAAIWNIAFLIENHKLSQEEIKQFKSAIRFEKEIVTEAINAFPEIADIICVEKVPVYDDLVCSFKIYAYIASKYYFFKGYNSMAKLLDSKSFDIRPHSQYSKDMLITRYYRHAIGGSVPVAMNNVGAALIHKVENGAIDKKDVYQQDLLYDCLKNASACGIAYSALRLARYMEYYSAPENEIIAQYQKALDLDVDITDVHGSALISLGNLEKIPDKKIEYFKRALDVHDFSAIVYLANEYAKKMRQTNAPEYWIKELRLLCNEYDLRNNETLQIKISQILNEAEEWYAVHGKMVDDLGF